MARRRHGAGRASVGRRPSRPRGRRSPLLVDAGRLGQLRHRRRAPQLRGQLVACPGEAHRELLQPAGHVDAHVRSRKCRRISPTIVGTAYVESSTPFSSSKRSIALTSPIAPTWTRSLSALPVPRSGLPASGRAASAPPRAGRAPVRRRSRGTRRGARADPRRARQRAPPRAKVSTAHVSPSSPGSTATASASASRTRRRAGSRQLPRAGRPGCRHRPRPRWLRPARQAPRRPRARPSSPAGARRSGRRAGPVEPRDRQARARRRHSSRARPAP